MFNFIKRFLLAWKLAKNPDVLQLLKNEIVSRETAQQLRMEARDRARVAMAELVPDDRHAHRKDLDITLQFECAEVMTTEEADQILEESRIENKPKLYNQVCVTQLGSKEELIKHNQKRHNENFLE